MRPFRTLPLALCTLFAAGPTLAQPDTPPDGWLGLDQATDGAYGISLDRAYETLLAGRTPGRTVVVAVIDGGVDLTHPDLAGRLWTNPGETPGNGTDDDGNGYVDDVHGWNFIGGADGRHVNVDSYELTREVARLRARFNGMDESRVAPADRAAYAEYQALEERLRAKRAETAATLAQIASIEPAARAMDEVLRRHFGRDTYTAEDVEAIQTTDPAVEEARGLVAFLFSNGISPAELAELAGDLRAQLDQSLNPDVDTRAVVGDTYADLSERVYGNADVTGPRPGHGTAVASLIAAVRGNGTGIDGVAEAVQIMAVRTVPNGDERDKDVANAIRYAVDGAMVVNMSFGKSLSPQKGAVDEAVRYAESRGVLLVHAAGNDGADIDVEPNFPTARYADGTRAANWIEVGASTWTDALAADFSNYGATTVDVFAPGARLTTLEPGGGTGVSDGTSLAAPVVSGLAALLLSHYPDLTPMQVRGIVLDSATRFPGRDVPRPGGGGLGPTAPFHTLSSTGGVVNAVEAIRRADALSAGTR